jgi:hypothetical protein
MAALLDDLPGEISVALDLLRGAMSANLALVRGNRVLSTVAAFLHGIVIALLLQAIVFLSLVLVSQSTGSVVIQIGPITVAEVSLPSFLAIYGAYAHAGLQSVAAASTLETALSVALLGLSIGGLAATLAAPRVIRARSA